MTNQSDLNKIGLMSLGQVKMIVDAAIEAATRITRKQIEDELRAMAPDFPFLKLSKSANTLNGSYLDLIADRIAKGGSDDNKS